MNKNIAYYLELENGEFELNEAVSFLRDMRVELAPHTALSKYLGKLELKIKNYMRETGQVPVVDKVKAQVILRKPTERIEVMAVKLLAQDLKLEGHEDIADRLLHLIVEKKNTPAVKFTYEDLVLK